VQFSAVRFAMGTGECGNFSDGMKVVAEWFPVRERAFAVGVFNSGSMIGSLVTPPLVVYITLHCGWRMAFLGPSFLGFIWVIAWRRVNRPLDGHPRVTKPGVSTSAPANRKPALRPPTAISWAASLRGD
jgi:MFS transporter, ACS family, hexuronate transporter